MFIIQRVERRVQRHSCFGTHPFEVSSPIGRMFTGLASQYKSVPLGAHYCKL